MSGVAPPVIADGLDLVVDRVERILQGTVSIALVRPDRAELPGYVPGSHLLVDCVTKVNAYSLTGDGQFPHEYTITVQLDESGGGGSLRMHQLVPGADIRVSHPRSSFPPVSNAAHHVLIAAGIGITPVLSHARSAARWGRSASVLYVHRPAMPALGDAVDAIGEHFANVTVNRFPGRVEFADGLTRVLTSSPLGSHLYVCGPVAFMDAVIDAARRHGWPSGRLHSESFGVSALAPGEPFTVRISGTTASIPVPSGVSLLEALEASGRTVPNMCRQGVCGECRLTVTSGRPLHRDLFLTDDEKAANAAIMACVSRCEDAEMEVAL